MKKRLSLIVVIGLLMNLISSPLIYRAETIETIVSSSNANQKVEQMEDTETSTSSSSTSQELENRESESINAQPNENQEVMKPVEKLELSAPKKIILVGEKITLKTQITPDDAADKTLVYQSSNEKIATVNSETGEVTGLLVGQTTIEVTNPSSQKQAEISITVVSPKLVYQTHVQTIGWQDWRGNGETSGTTGQSKRLEAIHIKIEDTANTGGIEYQTHIQSIGWQGWRENEKTSGTTGRSLRMEAIQIRLTGELANYYDIYYRAHVQKIGWLGWAKNGQNSGSQGLSARMEAIEIQIVPKDQKVIDTGRTFVNGQNVGLNYQLHIQKIGWQSYKTSGQIAGTTGESKRAEAINMKLVTDDLSGGIQYRGHVQGIGWQSWVSSGIIGTTGQSRRLEALEIKLTGEIAEIYDVYYRGHVQEKGWLAWTKNGGTIGSTGASKRLEAIEVRIIPKTQSIATGKSYLTIEDFRFDWVSRIISQNATNNQRVETAIRVGFSLYGKSPYVWGGGRTSISIALRQFDCSSFVHWMYSQAGKNLGNYQYVVTWSLITLGSPVNRNNIARGDLIFFANCNHVGVYLGDGWFIHDSPNSDTGGVGINNFSEYNPDHKATWGQLLDPQIRRVS